MNGFKNSHDPTAANVPVLAPLREGPDFTLYRARQRGNPSPVLVVALTAEQPSPQGLRRLKHEYSLAVELLSNLMASGQIHRGDRFRATHGGLALPNVFREAEALEAWEVAAPIAA
jgi:hypothetical protein